MNSCRLSTTAILLCAAMTGCYMNIKGVEDNSRLTSIEQRLSTVEQALGIPSPPPVQTGQSGDGAKVHIKQADYTESEETASTPPNGTPRTTRRSSPAQNSD